MQVKDYINKNLPNLNWNILPQIFEDEDIELTEEIKAYLRETPGNTNWNILKILSNENDDKISIKTIIISQNGLLLEGSDFNNATDVYIFLESNGTDYLIVKDFDQRVYDLDYKGLDSYNYIYSDGQEFQIVITNSNIEWFSND